jgi:hypothetical protein
MMLGLIIPPIHYAEKSCRRVDKLDFDTSIPGHGPMLTKEQVRIFRSKMVTLNERMAAFIKGGGKKTDIATKIRLDDLDWPFQPNALDGLFDELSKP